MARADRSPSTHRPARSARIPSALRRGARTARRLLLGLIHVLRGLATVLWRFPRLAPSHREARVQAWAAQLLELWGIRLRVEGAPPALGPALLVANHVSWLDILVIHATRHCRFVAKSEVARWPVLGRLASAAGTLYIERQSRRDAHRTVQRMAEALDNGEVLAVFPEGTTSDGRDVLPFHPNLLQAAIDRKAPAIPVGLIYLGADGQPSTHPAYVGDETLLASVLRTLGEPTITAVVRFGTPHSAGEQTRRAWAQTLHAQVRALRATLVNIKK
ncbi:lysophospholipid acyltransferase family protein [Tibeticola sp.]|uniref:lysophospholipid acyltransferase family protein n=1 Tax=Tibeticola sp. TaxID=2005368 RepID=UPI0025910D1E|nr:lysophospholipid acyltransferase family protein [Tibeticola sp.]MCI4441014.1 1-acyl-sn-glycerol-3-phosphate acyltransferase [Tibeticola sp.]